MAQQNLLGGASSPALATLSENWANLGNWAPDTSGGGTAGAFPGAT